MNCSLLYITSDAGHKRIPVFKVGVKISLQTEGEVTNRIISRQMSAWVTVAVRASPYLVHDGGRRGLDAWLLVREGQLLQEVHVGQGVLQGHVGRHGNQVLLTQNPTLGEKYT